MPGASERRWVQEVADGFFGHRGTDRRVVDEVWPNEGRDVRPDLDTVVQGFQKESSTPMFTIASQLMLCALVGSSPQEGTSSGALGPIHFNQGTSIVAHYGAATSAIATVVGTGADSVTDTRGGGPDTTVHPLQAYGGTLERLYFEWAMAEVKGNPAFGDGSVSASDRFAVTADREYLSVAGRMQADLVAKAGGGFECPEGIVALQDSGAASAYIGTPTSELERRISIPFATEDEVLVSGGCWVHLLWPAQGEHPVVPALSPGTVPTLDPFTSAKGEVNVSWAIDGGSVKGSAKLEGGQSMAYVPFAESMPPGNHVLSVTVSYSFEVSAYSACPVKVKVDGPLSLDWSVFMVMLEDAE